MAKYRPSQLAEEDLLGIAESPYLSQAVDHIREGYRRSVCGKHSIYYRITEQGAENMRVLGPQDPKENLT